MNSTIEALTTPSIALSGFVGTIIFAFISVQAKIKKNPLRFFISLEESHFMSSSMRLFRFFYLSLLIVTFSSSYSIFTVSVLSRNKFVNDLMNFIFPNPLSLLISIISFFIIMQILCLKIVQSRITDIMYNSKSTRKTRHAFILFSIIFIFIYLIFYSLVYGWVINELIIDQAKSLKISYNNILDILLSIKSFESSTLVILLVITVLYALLLFRVKNLFRYLGHSKIAINIFLKNGLTFSNKQLLHTDIESCYLISDSINIYDPSKYLIPKNNIEYISFTNTYCSLGKDIPDKGVKIITFENFTSDELTLFNSLKRKS